MHTQIIIFNIIIKIKNVINLIEYKKLLNEIEYNNNKMIIAINLYNESILYVHYIEYEYYKKILIDLNDDLKNILK